jgi:hypothetical protein
MINLNVATPEALSKFGLDLLSNYRDSLASFEEAAQICVKAIYDNFGSDDGRRTFALVRIYRLCKYDSLPQALQQAASSDIAEWMALMATIGIEPSWCSRHQSMGHKALPVSDKRSPMLAEAFNQIGFADIEETADTFLKEATFLTRYFHIEHAPGSPFVPAQSEFVEPYSIKSVIGIGSKFLSDSAYMALCFAVEHIDKPTAQKFANLSAYVSTLLAIYDGRGKIWQP